MQIFSRWKLCICLFAIVSVNAVQASARKMPKDAKDSDDIATDKETVQEQGTCADPSVVENLKLKIHKLKESHDAYKKEMEKYADNCDREKMELNDVLEKKIQNFDSLEQQLEKRNEDYETKKGELDMQRRKLLEMKGKTHDLEIKVKSLQNELDGKKNEMSQKDEHAQAKITRFTNEIKDLKREIRQFKKKNDALKYELDHQDDRLTLAALLSSYYDQGIEHIGRLTVKIQNLNRRQSMLSSIRRQFHHYRSIVVKSGHKYYRDYLASTVDPILLEIDAISQPYVKAYSPVFHEYKEQVLLSSQDLYNNMVDAFRQFRMQMILYLNQNPYTAPYARIIVDGILCLINIPIALIMLRYLLRLIWWLLFTLIYLSLCCFCCGKCARKRSKMKRKVPRAIKRPSHMSNNGLNRNHGRKNK